jgi:hypothetical protein
VDQAYTDPNGELKSFFGIISAVCSKSHYPYEGRLAAAGYITLVIDLLPA